MEQKINVCFVCTGNICRSPMAEVVFNVIAEENLLPLKSDSAGIGSWHINDDMDSRAKKALSKSGYLRKGSDSEDGRFLDHVTTSKVGNNNDNSNSITDFQREVQPKSSQHRSSLQGSSSHRAKQFKPEFFLERDLIVALDRSHYYDLMRTSRRYYNGKFDESIKMLLSFVDNSSTLEVPDPYYGSLRDFESSLKLIEQGVLGLISFLENADIRVRD